MDFKTTKVKYIFDREGAWMMLLLPKGDNDFSLENEVSEEKSYQCEVKLFKEKRSLDANSYCWLICDKIAKVIHDGKTTKEDIYREAIRQVGEFEDKPIPAEDVERHIKMWDKVGEGWFSIDLRESKLKGHRVVRDYYGSHVYDTASMSILIDYIVEQAKEMGIDTRTPDDIARLKASWEGGK